MIDAIRTLDREFRLEDHYDAKVPPGCPIPIPADLTRPYDQNVYLKENLHNALLDDPEFNNHCPRRNAKRMEAPITSAKKALRYLCFLLFKSPRSEGATASPSFPLRRAQTEQRDRLVRFVFAVVENNKAFRVVLAGDFNLADHRIGAQG